MFYGEQLNKKPMILKGLSKSSTQVFLPLALKNMTK